MLAFNTMTRIQSDVVMGRDPPAEETEEEATFRKGIERDFAKAKADGMALDFPDLKEGEEELFPASSGATLTEAAMEADAWDSYP